MIQLHTFHLSTNGRKVHMALEEAQATYEIVAVDLLNGAQKNADYLKLNPNGKVPTLVEDGLVMWESVAILLHVAEKFPAANLLPAAAGDRARAFQWAIWQPTTFGPPSSTLFLQLRFTPEDKQNQSTIDRARADIATNNTILADGLAGREYLAGPFSIADIALLPYLYNMVQLEVNLPPVVDAYYQRLVSRPSWQKVLEYKR